MSAKKVKVKDDDKDNLFMRDVKKELQSVEIVAADVAWVRLAINLILTATFGYFTFVPNQSKMTCYASNISEERTPLFYNINDAVDLPTGYQNMTKLFTITLYMLFIG